MNENKMEVQKKEKGVLKKLGDLCNDHTVEILMTFLVASSMAVGFYYGNNHGKRSMIPEIRKAARFLKPEHGPYRISWANRDIREDTITEAMKSLGVTAFEVNGVGNVFMEANKVNPECISKIADMAYNMSKDKPYVTKGENNMYALLAVVSDGSGPYIEAD